MYKVSSREVPPLNDPEHGYVKGLIVTVKPPIAFNAFAIENYLTWDVVEPVTDAKLLPGYELFNVTLLGSTDEATSIYASSGEDFIAGALKRTPKEVVKFIGFMGAEAVIE